MLSGWTGKKCDQEKLCYHVDQQAAGDKLKIIYADAVLIADQGLKN